MPPISLVRAPSPRSDPQRWGAADISAVAFAVAFLAVQVPAPFAVLPTNYRERAFTWHMYGFAAVGRIFEALPASFLIAPAFRPPGIRTVVAWAYARVAARCRCFVPGPAQPGRAGGET